MSGMQQPHTSPIGRLFSAQAGVATFRQLTGRGVSIHHVRAQVSAGRWRRFGEHCIVSHNFEPTRLQMMWIVSLDQPGLVAMAGLTALETAGFKFFGRELELIHFVVPRGAKSRSFPGTYRHESRRFFEGDVDGASPLPRTGMPRSAIDAAAWQPYPRYACGVLAAAVQQRLCTASELAAQMPRVGRVRHKAHMRLAIQDIAGGSQALSELDVAGMCRRFGLRAPDRQSIRRDRHGRKRYLDCEWLLPDGAVVVLEIDGAHHMEVEHWEADMKRERGVVISGRRVLRATATEARYDQAELAADLEASGIPRG